MKRTPALVTLTICSFVAYQVGSVAQDQFKKLSGTEIRAKFTGMEFTDEVHWDEIYGENGTLIGEEMGKRRVGTWRVENDKLCTDYGKIVGRSCYEVWMSGKSVQLMIQDSPAPPLEGFLENPRR
jgi:hypothetical protein